MYTCIGLPVWPRGLPLRHIKESNDPEALRRLGGLLKQSALPLRDIAVVQSLANNDSDVDAIYRLTQPLPFSFHFPKQVMQAGSSTFVTVIVIVILHLLRHLYSSLLLFVPSRHTMLKPLCTRTTPSGHCIYRSPCTEESAIFGADTSLKR